MEYPKDMDKECIPLCDALNKLPGIRTTYSCSGHGQRRKKHRKNFIIFFRPDNFESLFLVSRYLCSCPTGDIFSEWEIKVISRGFPRGHVGFLLSTNLIGKKAYESANRLAKIIENDIKKSKRMKAEL